MKNRFVVGRTQLLHSEIHHNVLVGQCQLEFHALTLVVLTVVQPMNSLSGQMRSADGKVSTIIAAPSASWLRERREFAHQPPRPAKPPRWSNLRWIPRQDACHQRACSHDGEVDTSLMTPEAFFAKSRSPRSAMSPPRHPGCRSFVASAYATRSSNFTGPSSSSPRRMGGVCLVIDL